MEQVLRILNLEDNPIDSELASELLKAEGLNVEIERVDTLADFRSALERGAYALILSDYTLPGLDSLDALKLARQMRPEIPVIFLSGTMGEEQAIETLKAGASDYVLKQRIGRLAPSARRALQEAEERSRLKQTEEALRDSEERLNIALAGGDLGVWDLDLLDHSVWRSLRHDQIFGYDSPLPGWTYEMFLEHVLDEDRREVDEKFRKALETGGEWAFHCRIRRVDGAMRWIWAQGRIRYDDNGNAVRMVGVVRDITSEKQVEELERRVEQRTLELKEKSEHLEEVNAALRILLRQREEDRKDFEEAIVANIKHLVAPYLENLKKSRLNSIQRTWIEILESNMSEITSAFTRKLTLEYLSLSSAELRVAALVRDGKRTKDIAEALGISEKAVSFHRGNIRSKLGLKRNAGSLRNHLMNLA